MFSPMNRTADGIKDRALLALNSTLLLPQALDAVRAPFLELVQADAMALCLMHVAPNADFRWFVPGHPLRILDEYASLIDHDFLRAPIFARPNVPVRDTQLLTRGEYERTLIYQRSRELDPCLEHIMAMLLPVRPGLVAALALYRNRQRAFTTHNSAVLSNFAPHLVNAVRNCGDFQTLMTGASLLDELYRRTDSAFLIVESSFEEALRSDSAVALLDRWFARSDLHSSGLPLVLKERLDALIRMDADARLGKSQWVLNHDDGNRTCRFVELPTADGPRRWALLLNETPHSIPLPAEMKSKLTPQQVTIATFLLRNWTNEQIASEIGRTHLTVKTHVRNIFDRLGIDSRADLIYQAARLNKPV
ncbi:response regulator transcription factor [Corallococcus exiguus]|nr:response regulator transcription factor [Corallococcus exiguus]RKH29371.1 DNA-binding response regulator [Corallococcus sp. CA041A]RKI20089.1 DNA-binding response regulator [Corallococcus sp. AB030]RUO92569.1 DNA-binding response regulator [Corallococcus sp. AB018]NRD53231.1 response regulator transcription factor [Corallococcus exiguus]